MPTLTANLEGLTDDTLDRMKKVLSLVLQGKAKMPLTTLVNDIEGGVSAVFKISRKAMTIDDVRISVNCETLQHIADYYNGHLLTQKLADDLNRIANVWIEPQQQPYFRDQPNSMARLYRVFDYDDAVSNAIGDVPDSGEFIFANEGKDWILDKDIFQSGKNSNGILWNQTATNHGWYKNKQSYNYGDPIQFVGHQHDIYHVDYSQLARIVLSDVALSEDGGNTFKETTFSEILNHEKYYKLASYTKGIKDRHPGVKRVIYESAANE